jgi:hypothetical protein
MRLVRVSAPGTHADEIKDIAFAAMILIATGMVLL